jgi:hypothetical protein
MGHPSNEGSKLEVLPGIEPGSPEGTDWNQNLE